MKESLRVSVGAVVLALATLAAVIFAWLNFVQRSHYDMVDDGVAWSDSPSGIEAWRIVPDSPASTAGIHPGDILALHTGWSDRAGSHAYHDHPYLSPAAAQWLADRRIKLLACDLPTPDQPIGRRPPGYDWPAHHILLGRGILISENVTGLGPIANQRAEFAFLALNIEESDGAPARVLARPIREQN